MCQVKARLWQRPRSSPDTFTLELQRRRGLGLTFNQIYNRLMSFFRSRNYDILPGDRSGPPTCQPRDLPPRKGVLSSNLKTIPPSRGGATGYLTAPPAMPSG